MTGSVVMFIIEISRFQGFGHILELVPKAESVIKLSAVCMLCFKNASYTKRLSSDTKVRCLYFCS